LGFLSEKYVTSKQFCSLLVKGIISYFLEKAHTEKYLGAATVEKNQE
jgi:hypothetical protein